MSDLRDITDEQLMLLLTTFIESGYKADPTSKTCNAIWRKHHQDFSLSREQVYRGFGIAMRRGFLRVSPPLAHALAQRIAEAYGAGGRFVATDLRVAKSRGSLPQVASHAADLVLELILLLGRTKKQVHLGLGAGRTTMFFAEYLAQILRSRRDAPELALHAMTAGFDPYETEKSPESFFGSFRHSGLDVTCYGMPAPPFVAWDQYAASKALPVVRESFALRDQIDIVVTSLASVHDPDGDLTRFLEVGGANRLAGLDQHKVVGDVQYCPYSSEGPVVLRDGIRAMTLFELDELRELAARKDKFVVLISGPCHRCQRTRTDALRPLVANPRLKVWSHLVCDLPTAEELVAEV